MVCVLLCSAFLLLLSAATLPAHPPQEKAHLVDDTVPFEDKEGRRNLALLGLDPGQRGEHLDTANASSVLPGFEAHQIAHLNDGFYGDPSSWISDGEPSWAEIDLGDVYTVNQVAFGTDGRAEGLQDRAATVFQILTATDYNADSNAASWQMVFQQEAGDPVTKRTEFSFDATEAQWVRINIDATNDGSQVRIDEMETYEAGLTAVKLNDKLAITWGLLKKQ
jgi:hypothetical protein